MIVVNIMGGLGNQMFQYAFGQALAAETGQDVRYVVDMLSTFSQARDLELEEVFGIRLPTANVNDISHIIGSWRRSPIARRILARPIFKAIRGSHFVAEHRFRFISDLKSRAASGAYLHGYWQSEQYFEGHAEEIHRYFQFQHDSRPLQQEVSERITKAPSIGIHVRRGDYVTNPSANELHGVLPICYYIRGVKELLSIEPSARIFIFSDDPNWAQMNLLPIWKNAECVTHNSNGHNFRDMQLLSQCDHLVIANSSFSWWAAWLNKKNGKTIIAPRKWFADSSFDESKIVPNCWLRR